METKSAEAVLFSAFSDEVGEIAKQAGLKEILLSDIPGTKDWIVGPMRKAMQSADIGDTDRVVKKVLRPRGAGQTANGAWDVSRQAAQMGV